jgi:hypothetical protein
VSSEITLVEAAECEVEVEVESRKVSVSSEDEALGQRKVSICSGSADSSGLFVSERKSSVAISKLREPFRNMPISGAAPEDIVEEIMDASTLFSRRCKRNRVLLRLRLSEEMLEDKEVLDALELAGKMGMAEGVEMRDEEGSVGWLLGLRRWCRRVSEGRECRSSPCVDLSK